MQVNPEAVDPAVEFNASEFQYIDISGIDGSQGCIVSTKQLRGTDAPSRARRRIRVNDTIVSTVRPNLRAIALVPPDYDGQVCSTGFAVLGASARVIPEFLYHFARSPFFIDQLIPRMKGSAYPAVTVSDVACVQLLLPPLPEQRRIVEIIDACMNRIQRAEKLHRRSVEATEALMPSVLAEEFKRLRRAGHCSARLGDMVEFLDHMRIPVNAEERVKRPGPYPYYGANGQVGVIDDYIFDDELVLLAEDGGFFLNPLRPIAYRVSGKCWVNNHAHVLRPKTEAIDPDFLCHALNEADVSNLVTGSTRLKLNQRNARKIQLLLPPLREQRRVVKHAAVVAQHVRTIATMQLASRSHLDAISASVLRCAFTGN